MKLLLLAAMAVLAWRLVAGRWPWIAAPRRSRGAPGADQARILLGLGRNATRQEVIEAHRNLISTVHPDRGGTSELVHEANLARDALLRELAMPPKDNQ